MSLQVDPEEQASVASELRGVEGLGFRVLGFRGLGFRG